MFDKEKIIIYILKNKVTIILSFITSIILCLVLYFFNISREPSVVEVNKSDVNNDYKVVSQEEKNNDILEKNEDKIIIDIKGAVKKPGVYELVKGQRIKDAIDIAGGLLEDADTSSINLSQKVNDQMLLKIPKLGEKLMVNMNDNKNQPSKVININVASKEELMNITGVGETKAKAIIDYRENKGDFKTKEDIMKVKGIGKGTFEKIKEEISV